MNVSIESSWQEVLNDEFRKPYFHELVNYIKKENTEFPGAVFPKENEIFRAFEECPFSKVKVVILGQDPYPTIGHAHGLCFSVDKDVKPLPKSLKNIYREMQSDLRMPSPLDGDLSHWATQGILLLNTVLTVREGKPDSHANKGWEKFTDAVIEVLNKKKTGLVYILWGSKAQRKAENVNAHNNLVIKAPHPSPLSAHRGFFGSQPFTKTNSYLLKNGQTAIKWC